MSSKICIVSTANIKHMTLVSMYTSILDQKDIDYDLIYLDRYDIKEYTTAKNVYKFTKVIPKNSSSSKKIPIFFKFRNYAKKILKKNHYDIIIVWNTLTSLLLYTFLLKNKQKYILNIRDYYNENNQIIFNMHKKLIKNSLFSTISSRGFKKFLPNDDYVFVNSLNENIINTDKNIVKRFDGTINIGFLGNVRFYEEQIKLIDALKNDTRFKLWYCGTNSENLEKYVRDKNISNCKFVGQFNPSETISLLSNFDMINNVFGNETVAVRTLTSIRLYYSSMYEIPILVNSYTHMSEIVNNYGLGLSINIDNYNLSDEIYNYFMNLNRAQFHNNAKRFNKEVKKENKNFKTLFNDTLKKLW